jgi:hypothetical protein
VREVNFVIGSINTTEVAASVVEVVDPDLCQKMKYPFWRGNARRKRKLMMKKWVFQSLSAFLESNRSI